MRPLCQRPAYSAFPVLVSCLLIAFLLIISQGPAAAQTIISETSRQIPGQQTKPFHGDTSNGMPGKVVSLVSSNFSEFTARLDRQRVILQWSIIKEEQPQFFTVQRSEDGHFFTDDALVFTSDEETPGHAYRYADPLSPESSTRLYFRIRYLDRSAHCHYSGIVLVSLPTALYGTIPPAGAGQVRGLKTKYS